MLVPEPGFPSFPPAGFPSITPSIPEHPVFVWRNRNQGTPKSRDDDFIRSIRHISMRKSQRHPSTGMLPESVHHARVLNEMKQTLGYVIKIFTIF